MVFSSTIFIYILLPLVIIPYYLFGNIKFRNVLLLVSSLAFYSFGEPRAAALMLVSVLINYLCGRFMSSKYKKAVLAVCCTINLGLLFVYKYLGYVTGLFGLDIFDTALPLGISFFTFQAMSYVIDCYRDDSLIQKNPFRLALYIAFFPQLIAGPIVRYHDIAEQIENRSHSAEKLASGMKRFCFGAAKKLIIADTAAKAVSIAFGAELSSLSAFSAWTGAVCYAVQIYYDFSGYSDMALGLGKMFGFEFRENFNYPYASSSVTEFWRRWHISVSEWFREYLYIPLGGNRKGKARTIINKWIVFISTGIWHGANLTFLVWGMIHGACLTAESLIPKKEGRVFKAMGRLYTLLAVLLSFVIFRADSLSHGIGYIGRMFSAGGSPALDSQLMLEMTPWFIIIMTIAVIFSAPCSPALKEKFPRAAVPVSYITAAAVYILSLLTLSEGGYSPFIYYRF